MTVSYQLHSFMRQDSCSNATALLKELTTTYDKHFLSLYTQLIKRTEKNIPFAKLCR